MTKKELNKRIMELIEEVSNFPEEVEGVNEDQLREALWTTEDSLAVVRCLTE